MALTVTVVSPSTGQLGLPAQLAQKGGQGWLRVRVATMTGDSSYPSGGYSVTGSTFQFANAIVGIQVLATSASNLLNPVLDIASASGYVIRVYGNVSGGTATFSEVGIGANLSTFTWRVLAYGL